ncbi:MAG: hypothetical protein ACLR2G_02840 [Phascolarctobacterium faecium]
MTNMVAAGGAGGILEIVMDRLAAQFEKIIEWYKFKSTILSGNSLSVATLYAIIMMFVMPVFVGLFEQQKSNFHLSPCRYRQPFHQPLLVFGYCRADQPVFINGPVLKSFRLWRDGVIESTYFRRLM